MDLKKHLFLFDIDGTIIDTGSDGKKAITKALEDSLEIKIESEINLRGGIDIVFFRQFYEQISLPGEEISNFWEIFKGKYIHNMKFYFENPWIIFPNSIETIEFLFKHSNIALATGNMKAGAEIKLEKFGLNKFFNCGGFGDDVNNRSEIVKYAIDSSEFFYKQKFDKKNIYLFGDTEKDIKSALDNDIIPVLIDHKKNNVENARIWKARYHGDFLNINKFINIITEKKSCDNLIYF
jgi:phosphoglycolate phosphatase